MDYYQEIKTKIIDDEVYGQIKNYSKERHKVITYFEIGKLLYEAGSIYGEDIIGKYSEKLMIEVGKKYNRRTLYRMKQFYIMFREEKVSPTATQLTWSHYIELLPIKDEHKRLYYLNVAINSNLSRNELRQRMKSNEFERLPEETKNKLIAKARITVKDLIKNPIIIKNNYNCEIISEKLLQKLIMEDIVYFLNELGDSFCFVSNEYKIKLGNYYNYIDLLLYNIQFHCYVVIELKVTELKKEHIGQIQVYMNYIDHHLKTIQQDKTIGIIICKRNNQLIMEYCSDKRILTKEYKFM